ncbi:MAG TPA: hypothetical protein VGI22_24675, partial [Xanthobacteraceae bacterium]
ERLRAGRPGPPSYDRSIARMIEELDQLNRGLERLVEERTLTLRQREEELLRRIFDLTPRSTTCRKRC